MPIVTDPARIRAVLEADRAWAIYALGDLSPTHAPYCTWYAAAEGAPALLLLYDRVNPTVLYLQGTPDQVAPLLDELPHAPTRELYLLARPEHLPLLEARYQVSGKIPMWRMTLNPARFADGPRPRAARLGLEAAPALEALFADGQPHGEAPDFFFPALVAEGVYYGVWEAGGLIAAAGTHLVAPEVGVGAIGNVYTRRDRRGQGLSRLVTGAVTSALMGLGVTTIGLNVRQDNVPAQRVYAALGFEHTGAFYEGLARRRA